MSSSFDPRKLFERGLADYHAGEHYEAHEHWETVWQEEHDDRRRDFLQALIQIASAVHKARNDVAPRGSVRLLERATEKLAPLTDEYLGIDVAALRVTIAACAEEVARQIEQNDGHCSLGEDHIPAIVQLAEPPVWLRREHEPTVPAAARSAWFDKGLATYRAGEYFEAHELWEEIWRDEPDAYEKQFVQGLIQVAAAMHKVVEQRKPAPAARLLERALLRLRNYVPKHGGLDIERLVRDGESARSKLLTLEPGSSLDLEDRPRMVTAS